MSYSRDIEELRTARLRPFAATALLEARGYSSDDLASITGQTGYRHSLLAAAARQFADEAATEAEQRADADAVRREREEFELADFVARNRTTTAASRAAESAVAAAGWTMTYRHGSSGGSLYYWVKNPADDCGERYSLRISDHRAPNGAGWNDAKQQRHDEPDLNIVIRRTAHGEYTFDLSLLFQLLGQ